MWKSWTSLGKRPALLLAIALAVLSALLVVTLAARPGQVRRFSWADRVIHADDRAFSLTFSRAVDRDSIEDNLILKPDLPGQFRWEDDRRLTYVLDQPAPYGFEFSLGLSGGQVLNREASMIAPFEASFRSADRAIVYIGIEPEERGRLVLYNFTRNTKTILTPPDLSVMSYAPYSEGDRLLFSALDRTVQNQRLLDVQLYTVTTGLDREVGTNDTARIPPGQLAKRLDDPQYQTLQFALASNDNTIVVQRADRQNPGANFGLWLLRDDAMPAPIVTEPGGLFILTPDGSAIATSQSNGIAILSLDPLADPAQLIVLFPEFGRPLDISDDGQQLAMLKFNPDYTQSIFRTVNEDIPQELLTVTGAVVDAQFDPTGEILYALLLAELDTDTYQAEPQLVAIHLTSKTVRELARFATDQRDLQFQLSPDGQAIVFDQLQTATGQQRNLGTPRTPSGEAIVGGNLQIIVPLSYLRDAPDSEINPTIEPLGLTGIRPRWLP